MPDITISLTAGQATRVENAMGMDQTQVRDWLIEVLVQNVKFKEHRAAQDALPEPADLTIS